MSTPARTPWHERAGITPDQMRANLAALRDEIAGKSPRERNAAAWAEAFATARRHGFDPAQAAAQATVEIRTAPRFRAETPVARPRPASASLARFTLADFGDRIGWVSDNIPDGAAFHDPNAERGPGLVSDEANPISAARAEIIRQAEFDYAADCTAETGAAVSPEQYEKMQKNRRKLTAMTEQIAARLKVMNIAATRPDAVKCWAYWVHSQHMEELPAYRRICILPTVAASIRAPKLAALEYWLDRHEYARFWTFTTGERCRLRGVDGLEARLKWLTRKLSKLNHALARYGVEIVFRSVEFGGLEKKTHPASERMEGGGLDWTEDGSPLFHPHAHCVVIAHFGYNPARWQEVTQMVRDFWRRGGARLHCDFGEIIGNARECCKYVTKPGDLLKLSDADLAELFEITYRAKLCHPMGSLAREIRIREGHTVTIQRDGVAGEKRAALDAALDEDAEVPDGEFVGIRQARTLRQLAAKHRVPLAALHEQNPDLTADPDARLDYGARVVIFPGGRCLRRVRQNRRMVWVERLDHNKTARETARERAERESLEDAFAATDECARLAAVDYNGALPWEADRSGDLIGPGLELQGPALATLSAPWLAQDARNYRRGRTGCPTRVVARLMPAAGPSRIKEPRVLIMSMDGRKPDLGDVRAHPLVIGLWVETVEKWEAGQADARLDAQAQSALDRYSVHTGTPTVHGGAPDAPPEAGEAHFRAELDVFKATHAFAEGINF